MIIYRAISYEEAQNTDWSTTGTEVDVIAGMVQDGILTPVKKCAHRKYDRHVVASAGVAVTRIVCPGAGLEDTP